MKLKSITRNSPLKNLTKLLLLTLTALLISGSAFSQDIVATDSTHTIIVKAKQSLLNASGQTFFAVPRWRHETINTKLDTYEDCKKIVARKEAQVTIWKWVSGIGFVGGIAFGIYITK